MREIFGRDLEDLVIKARKEKNRKNYIMNLLWCLREDYFNTKRVKSVTEKQCSEVEYEVNSINYLVDNFLNDSKDKIDIKGKVMSFECSDVNCNIYYGTDFVAFEKEVGQKAQIFSPKVLIHSLLSQAANDFTTNNLTEARMLSNQAIYLLMAWTKEKALN